MTIASALRSNRQRRLHLQRTALGSIDLLSIELINSEFDQAAM